MLIYTKPRIACERFKGPLFCACAYMLCTVTVTEQETRLSSPAMVLSHQEVHYNGSASEEQSTGQEKPGLNVKINTNIATRLQNLEVQIHSCRVKAYRNFKAKVEGDTQRQQYTKTAEVL